jgi:DNA-binding transcriptional LysR family regulator
MIDKLELAHLRTLDALNRCASMSAAAEHLHVSQQAVSLQLKKIRTLLGDPLFVRTGHGMAPTPYAKLIAPHVSAVLAHLNAIPLPSKLQPEHSERTLVISGTDYTQKVVVADLVRDLRLHAPRVKVALVGIEVEALGRKMQQGEIDLVFTVDGSVAPGLVAEPLFLEQYRCVTGNPALAGASMTPAQLVEHDFIVTSPGGAHFKGSADGWFARQGLERRVVAAAPTFFMTLEYLKGSNLVAFIPARLLPVEGLHEIALTKSPPGYTVVAACHPSARSDPFMTWVLDRVKARLIV